MGCFDGGDQRRPGTGSDEAAAQVAMRNENLRMPGGRRVNERHEGHTVNRAFWEFVQP